MIGHLNVKPVNDNRSLKREWRNIIVWCLTIIAWKTHLESVYINSMDSISVDVLSPFKIVRDYRRK